ncbi:hypothetical protein DFH27DRAFT_592696 [Peziza echinospora]|nr:hypothetical protein DFH27DRAFT_592696 [Peziza echinospora]
MPIDRSVGRNVHFYDATSPNNALGGFIQNGSVMQVNFLGMLGILLVTRPRTDIWVQKRGWDYIYLDAFRNGIRTRDGKCVISGTVNRGAYRHAWFSFESAQIFPGGYRDMHITDMDHHMHDGMSNINSLQNGMLDGYIIVAFDDDMFEGDGKVFHEACRNPSDLHCVLGELLRWHFRQSVLANMRGVGEPIFEHDFGGLDMIGEISEGRYGKERLDMEVASRLRGFLPHAVLPHQD